MFIYQVLIKNYVEYANNDDEIKSRNEFIKIEQNAKIQALLAKVEQENAIAKRIENAEEVTIEEFYSDDIQGKAGVNLTSETVSIGLSGSNKNVTKRIYTFKGKCNDC